MIYIGWSLVSDLFLSPKPGSNPTSTMPLQKDALREVWTHDRYVDILAWCTTELVTCKFIHLQLKQFHCHCLCPPTEDRTVFFFFSSLWPWTMKILIISIFFPRMHGVAVLYSLSSYLSFHVRPLRSLEVKTYPNISWLSHICPASFSPHLRSRGFLNGY